MLAVLLRDLEMAEWLIWAGARLDATDLLGRTALSLAEEIADERLVELLRAKRSGSGGSPA